MNYTNLAAPATTWDDFQQQNIIVKDWASTVRNKLKTSAAQFQYGKKGTVQRKSKGGAVHDEEKLKDSIRQRLYKKHGITEGVGFRIERHGVFVHKGVGRGYKMVNGMVQRIAKNPPTGRTRRPVDWFNVVIEQSVPELADKIAQVNADAAVNAARMRIN